MVQCKPLVHEGRKAAGQESVPTDTAVLICQTVWRSPQGTELQTSLSIGTMCSLAEIERTSRLAM